MQFFHEVVSYQTEIVSHKQTFCFGAALQRRKLSSRFVNEQII